MPGAGAGGRGTICGASQSPRRQTYQVEGHTRSVLDDLQPGRLRVCSAPHCICLGFHLWSPTSSAPKSLPFWKVYLPATVRNETSPWEQGGPLSRRLLVLRFGWCVNECGGEGARSWGSPWPGCSGVYSLLSPPLSSLSFPALPSQAFPLAFAGCPTPFPCSEEFVRFLQTHRTFLGLLCRNILGQTP